MDRIASNRYNFELPEELIAQFPSENRGESKLLVADGTDQSYTITNFKNLIEHLSSNHFLVVNNTKVLKARLFGEKDSRGRIEVFLLEDIGDKCFKALIKGKVRNGQRINLKSSSVYVEDELDDGIRIVRFELDPYIVMETEGHVPLPPYIKRSDQALDFEKYQTIYAKNSGSVAAPTAGLHFSQEIFDRLKECGVEIIEITLNVGIGTFRPIKADYIDEHKMHEESYTISADAFDKINRLKSEGKRLVAVGSTTVRALESAANESCRLQFSGSCKTDIFIYEGYRFKIVDDIITNFHLPRSTLIVMMAAFAGLDNIMNAYKFAINNRLRFFSYGDAMLIKNRQIVC